MKQSSGIIDNKSNEKEEAIKFGIVEEYLFPNLVIPIDDHNNEHLKVDSSKKFWDHLKYKTTVRVNFHIETLVSKYVEEFEANQQVPRAMSICRKTNVKTEYYGVHSVQVKETTSVYKSQSLNLPDLITYLQKETNLTRRTIVKIINDNGRLESFYNPQKFIEKVSTFFKHQIRLLVVDWVKYLKIGNDHSYV